MSTTTRAGLRPGLVLVSLALAAAAVLLYRVVSDLPANTDDHNVTLMVNFSPKKRTSNIIISAYLDGRRIVHIAIHEARATPAWAEMIRVPRGSEVKLIAMQVEPGVLSCALIDAESNAPLAGNTRTLIGGVECKKKV